MRCSIYYIINTHPNPTHPPSSRARRSDSDTESLSESSPAGSRRHTQRQQQSPGGPTEGEEVTEYMPTFDGNRSLYVPTRMWTGRVYQGEEQQQQQQQEQQQQQQPKRPTSLYLRRDPEEGQDFYDILAEKYGITNVIRYDLPRDSRTRYLTDSLAENRRTVPEKKKEAEERSPSGERMKTPSERLAMVLNRLENCRKEKKEGKTEEACEGDEKEWKKEEDEAGKSKIPRKVSECGEKEEEKPRERKSKFLTSLERKLERLRTNSEKKYVDKAIRSLRESSLGPKDVSSENVLIKRAVSLSDCHKHAGKIQSTVNSVLGMFKKLENSEKKKETEEKWKSPAKPPPRIETRRPVLPPNGYNLSFPTSPDSPDADSFDSWSNCSEAGNLDDFLLHGRTHSRMTEPDTKESVSDRIRRKSFYTRFNERKKPRRSSLLGYDADSGMQEPRPRPSYYRSVSSGDEARPRPFYGSESPSRRKTSFDWSKSVGGGYLTLPRNLSGFSYRSPETGYSCSRPHSPRPLSPNNLE